jgi:hypothetical protein
MTAAVTTIAATMVSRTAAPVVEQAAQVGLDGGQGARVAAGQHGQVGSDGDHLAPRYPAGQLQHIADALEQARAARADPA